jgi:hypothetical protein
MDKAVRIIATIGMFALFALGPLASAQEKNGAYYCVADASGGIFYDDNSKRWEGTTFCPSTKFVVRLTFAEHKIEKNFLGDQDDHNYYKIAITDSGDNYASPCTSDNTGEVIVLNPGLTRCSVISDYVFDFKNNRFLSAYLLGYVGGKDNNENTPAVSAGTCTKIE